MLKLPIYLDNNATTAVNPRVLEAMLPYFTEVFGNAASTSHPFGWAALEAVSAGRAQVAALIGAHSKEIVFTSGATESDNLALKGVAEMYASKGDHIITVQTEHKAILDSGKHLEALGKRITYLPVDKTGRIDLAHLEEAITDRTILVSVMFGNNETGTLQPIAEIGKICRTRGVLFHTDATQGAGKIPIDVNALQIDLLSLSAHKIHGPKGVGALYVRARDPRVRVKAEIDGGGHENGMRSGTLNVAGIAGFGKACELCRLNMADDAKHSSQLRDRLEHILLTEIPDTEINGHPTERLPNTVNVYFRGVEADAILTGLTDVAVSSGSACSSASMEQSHVLRAIGRDESNGGSLHLSLSRFTTIDEVDYAANRLKEIVAKQRRLTAPAPVG